MARRYGYGSSSLQEDLMGSVKNNDGETDITLLLDSEQLKQYEKEVKKFVKEIEKQKLTTAQKELAISKKSVELARDLLKDRAKQLKEEAKQDAKSEQERKEAIAKYTAAAKAIKEENQKSLK